MHRWFVCHASVPQIPAILNVGGKKGSSGGMGSKEAVQQQQEQSGKKTFDLKGIFGGKKD